MPEASSTTTRSFWSGTLSFGLVSIPVDLYAANRGRGLSLKMLGPEGQPLKRQFVCAEEGKPLDRDDLVRGFEAEQGKFLPVTSEELEALEPDKTRDIDLNRFVDRSAISPAYFERSYYLVPSGNSAKAYRLLADTMQNTGRAGIATFIMRSKAYVVAIFAENGILHAQTLRFHDELRTPDDVGLPAPAKVPPKLVAQMKATIEAARLKRFAGEELEDEQAETLRKMAEGKLKRHQDVVEMQPVDDEGSDDDGDADEEGGAEDALEPQGQVIDLMQVLRSRLGAKTSPVSHKTTAGAAPANDNRAKGSRAKPAKAPSPAKPVATRGKSSAKPPARKTPTKSERKTPAKAPRKAPAKRAVKTTTRNTASKTASKTEKRRQKG